MAMFMLWPMLSLNEAGVNFRVGIYLFETRLSRSHKLYIGTISILFIVMSAER
jgi:hypothetical protein